MAGRPKTGEVVFWTSDTGIDGENPVDIDEVDLITIDPRPSYVWLQAISSPPRSSIGSA